MSSKFKCTGKIKGKNKSYPEFETILISYRDCADQVFQKFREIRSDAQLIFNNYGCRMIICNYPHKN